MVRYTRQAWKRRADDPAEVRVEPEPGTIRIHLSGDWILSEDLPRWRDLERTLDVTSDEIRRLLVVADDLGRWDTAIIPFFLAAQAAAKQRGWEFEFNAVPEGVQRLLELATAVPEKEGARRATAGRGFFERVGLFSLYVTNGLLAWMGFIGDIVLALGRTFTRRRQARARDLLLILEEVGAKALPIVTLISFLVGTIITFLGIVVLVRFNAEFYVSYLVGYGILREMGALMTAIILSGRTGAAFAALIGSMKVNEEIDALQAIGIDPIEFLVLPRILGMIFMVPLLTIYANVIGIGSGMFVAHSMQGMRPEIFIQGLLQAVAIQDLLLGLVKGVVFGLLIALSGCLRGLQCGNDAGAVGSAATSAVVTSITLIIASNALIDWVATLYGI